MTSTLKPCGTYAAYRRHRLRGEEPCPECLSEGRAYQREWYRRHRKLRPSKIKLSIRDVLSTYYPERLTTDTVVTRVLQVHPDWNPDSIRRMLVRSEMPSELRDGRRVWWCESWD